MQNSNHLLMIRPVNFGYNAQTAVNNNFQTDTGDGTQQKAVEEFDAFVQLLQNNKVDVTVVEDTPEPFTPDSIFPNNWISFHENGFVFLYPMFAENRRQERKTSVVDVIKNKFIVTEIKDFSIAENENIFLEGTGSMVLDRENKIAYACISPRTNERLLNDFCNIAGYTAVSFTATDENDVLIYHTNVMMCVADKYAVVCLSSIIDEKEKNKLISSLQKSGKEIIEISFAQLQQFAGNMLQVKTTEDELLLVMSTQAYNSLNTIQRETLEQFNRIIHSPLHTIETAGGGSARCMMAEVFLEKRKD
ncbi:MAG: amidinotransferase [Ferruginibacter sp.]|nr:amidinotransferase [Bacteroidota bacterium]MBX2920032.1 amidinotransferase [Ferruginibacter sp.]MCB0708441.1 amidinotransferase [Chitinophagaceae bacterium]MCC7379958.1 amidinotransferase [Chitinophagaceae bacterium]